MQHPEYPEEELVDGIIKGAYGIRRIKDTPPEDQRGFLFRLLDRLFLDEQPAYITIRGHVPQTVNGQTSSWLIARRVPFSLSLLPFFARERTLRELREESGLPPERLRSRLYRRLLGGYHPNLK